jgi:hypothetical protein
VSSIKLKGIIKQMHLDSKSVALLFAAGDLRRSTIFTDKLHMTFFPAMFFITT